MDASSKDCQIISTIHEPADLPQDRGEPLFQIRRMDNLEVSQDFIKFEKHFLGPSSSSKQNTRDPSWSKFDTSTG